MVCGTGLKWGPHIDVLEILILMESHLILYKDRKIMLILGILIGNKKPWQQQTRT
jgi:hypothetical protein